MNENTHTYRKKFPLGYLLHPYPISYGGWSASNDSSCDRILAGVLFIFYLTSAHRSSLAISPEGLVLCLYPAEPLAVPWSDVLRLEQRRLLGIPYATLRVDRPYDAVFPRPLFLSDADRQRYEAMRLGIPLWQFEGWPQGGLADDLNYYLPEVMGEKNVPDGQISGR